MAGWFSKLVGKFRGTRSTSLAKMPPKDRAKFQSELKMRAADLLPESWAGRPLTWTLGSLFGNRCGSLGSTTLTDHDGFLEFTTTRAIRDGYKRSSYVYICVQRNANAIASVGLPVERFVGVDENNNEVWERVGGMHPLQKILDRPNDIFGRQAHMLLTAIEMYITGNSVWCLNRSPTTGEVLEIWTLPPERTVPIPSKEVTIAGYEVTRPDGSRVIIPGEDTVHIQFPSPGRPWWGMAPLEAAWCAVDVDRKAAHWQAKSLDNMMVPAGVFKAKGNLDEKQFDDFQDQMAEEYAGAERAGRPMVLGSDIEWLQLGMKPKDVMFLDSRKVTREEICSIFGVPPPVAGILERATYSNIETARRIWWEDTLVPFLGLVTDAINAHLVPLFEQPGERLRVVADTSGVAALREGLETTTKIAKDWFEMGIPLNQLIEELDTPFSQVEEPNTALEVEQESDGMQQMNANFERIRNRFSRIEGGLKDEGDNVVPIKKTGEGST